MVQAERLSAEFVWHTASGHEMTAAAGDYLVRDASGGPVRSVKADTFVATHTPLEQESGSDDPSVMRFYRRRGRETARFHVGDDLVVTSREGRQIATSGTWILGGHEGDQWVAPQSAIQRGYELA